MSDGYLLVDGERVPVKYGTPGQVFQVGQRVRVAGLNDDDVAWFPDDNGEEKHPCADLVGREGVVVAISTAAALHGRVDLVPTGCRKKLGVGESVEDPVFVVRFRGHRDYRTDFFWGEEIERVKRRA